MHLYPSTERWLLPCLLAICACGTGLEEGETLAISNWYSAEGQPRPTSDLLGDVWGEDNGVERKRWLAEMHRTAQGDDWRALERANASAELSRRAGEADAPGEWAEVGSNNQAGHTRCVASGEHHLYLGSANGGLWRGEHSGANWQPISDQLFGGVDEVVALPARGGDQLLVRRGSELFWSGDGGVRWSAPTGIEGVVGVYRLLQLPGAPGRALLLARGTSGRVQLLKSDPTGEYFEPCWSGVPSPDADLWVARCGPRAGLEVWIALGGQLLRSLDGGETFTAGPALEGEVDAVRLAASEAGAPMLYLAARVGGTWRLYRGEPQGALTLCGTLEDFWGGLAAFPGDADVILVGGLEAHRSTDGGSTFRRINSWGQYYGDPSQRLHADIRGMTCSPDTSRPGEDLCWISTDGGTYLSRDRGQTVHNLCQSGLGIGQIYSTLTSTSDPDLILAGTQDQGYQRGQRRAPSFSGPSTPFDQLLSGDYGYLVSTSGDHDLVYSSYPGFVLVQQGMDDPELLYPWVDLPPKAQHAWMPPLVADPIDSERFFLLADSLYRYRRHRGAYWAYRVHSQHDFTAGGGSYLVALGFATNHPERAHAANDVGRIWSSEDGGRTWSEGEVVGSRFLRPTCIMAHPRDDRRAAIGGSGYSGPGVLETRDGGRQWLPLARGLPRTLVHDLAWSPRGDLYAATEAGAWWLPSGAARWRNLMGHTAPATSYWSVEWVVGRGIARFGTYGRGVWDFRPSTPSGR